MPATTPSAAAATSVAAMAAPTSSAIASDAICGSRHAGDCNLRYCRDPSRCHGSSHSGKALSWPAMPSVGAGMPATAPSAAAATPVAAMASPTSAAIASDAICGSRHAGDCNLRYCRDPSRCHGSSHRCHRQRCHLWEPACRRLQPPLLLRPQSLPWQLPQWESAVMASDASCGSRHAGDRTLRCCCDSGRCHGSSHQCCHRQRCQLWEPVCRRRRNSRSPQSLLFRIPGTTVRTPTSGLPPARMRC